MKNKFLKLVILSTVLAFSSGLLVHAFDKNIEKVEAAQVIDNFDSYTYSGDYYDSIDLDGTEGLNGSIRTALTTLIHPSGWYTYGSSGETHLSTQLQYADEDPTNSSNMIYLYTRDSVKKNAASTWNREHVWPQNLSNGCWGEGAAGTDILHIRPTYNDTNNERSNDKYGDTNKANPLTYSGMVYGYETGSKFEPLDSVKGDVARIIMYVWTAYKNHYSNLPLVTSVFESYDTMLEWHTLDQPDVMEGNRNNYSETSKQKNRNPFVDHPELAWKIFGDSASPEVKEDCMQTYPGTGSVRKLESIAISGEPLKKEYYSGSSFDPKGLIVTAYYDDETTKNVPLDSCTWSPDPLTVGTTTVTCTYGKKTATYSGITVIKNENEDYEYKVAFRANGSDDGTRLDGNAVYSNQLTSNTLISGASNSSNIFAGDLGLKFGSGSAGGSITFTLKSVATVDIEYIKIESSKYKAEDTYFSLTIGTNAYTASFAAGTTFTRTLNDLDATTLTLSTSPKRAYLNSITIRIKADSPIVPPTSSSSLPPSSSSNVPPSSSSNMPSSSSSDVISSSSIPTYDSSSNQPSSSSLGSSSSSLMPISSSSEVISSSSLNTSSQEITSSTPISSSENTDVGSSSEVMISSNEQSSQNDNTSSSGEAPSKKSGCGGSLVALLPVTGFSAIIGLVFVLSKKKK